MWTEFRGVCDLEWIVCPHCEAKHETVMLGAVPIGTWTQAPCPDCAKVFWWLPVSTPLGRGYQTWNDDPRTPIVSGPGFLVGKTQESV